MPLRTTAAACLCTISYLFLRIHLDPELFKVTSNAAQQTGIAILLGILVFASFIGIYRFNNFLNNRWLKKIGPMELFKMCNDTAKELHAEICQMFSSEEMNGEDTQSLFLGGQADCFIYSFGLVSISMNTLDKKFLQSKRFNEFNSRVLQRLVNLSKEKYSSMNLDMDLAEEQLKKSKTKELQSVMNGIVFYQEQSTARQYDPLSLLVKDFSKRTSLKGTDNIHRLIATSNRILQKTEQLVLSYKT